MNRGQSSIVGIALITGMTIALAGTIVIIGGPVLTDAQNSVKADQAEQSMTQFDSRASTVSLGDSPRQRIRLSNNGEGQVRIDEKAGSIKVLTVDEAGTETVVNESFGAVSYDIGKTSVVYQGGGVWRKENGGSVMVSPPEYRYNGDTLTFPIVQVTGEDWTGSPNIPLQLYSGNFEQLYPTATDRNPLGDGHVHVEVTSEFHRGWKDYFETRTEGVIEHDPSQNQVTVNLTVPFTENFDDPLVVTANETIDNPCGGFPDCQFDDRPSASPKIEEKISDCETGGCKSGFTDGSFENGTYYEDGDVILPESTFDTSEGDISLVIDGDLEFGAGGGGGPGR